MKAKKIHNNLLLMIQSFINNHMMVDDIMGDRWMFELAGRMAKNDFHSICRELKSMLGKLAVAGEILAAIDSAALRREHFIVDSTGHGSMEEGGFFYTKEGSTTSLARCLMSNERC